MQLTQTAGESAANRMAVIVIFINLEKIMFFIGSLRIFLMMPFSCKWNAWVRDITAKYEGSWLIRSKI